MILFPVDCQLVVTGKPHLTLITLELVFRLCIGHVVAGLLFLWLGVVTFDVKVEQVLRFELPVAVVTGHIELGWGVMSRQMSPQKSRRLEPLGANRAHVRKIRSGNHIGHQLRHSAASGLEAVLD